MPTVRHWKRVDMLTLGDVVTDHGAVRSIIPAPGGQLYVVTERPKVDSILTTNTWAKDVQIEVEVAEEPTPELKPGGWLLLDKNGNAILDGRDLHKFKTVEDALVAARRWAATHIGGSQGCVVVKIVTKVYSTPGEPVVHREDFS
jgi:hypothetical protein